MPRSNVLIVVVDGLCASALGAYGNTHYSTPALDSFAAESLLLDWCYAPSDEIGGVYGALWSSLHPERFRGNKEFGGAGNMPNGPLPRMFADFGYHTVLVTDEPKLTSLPEAVFFHDQVLISIDNPLTLPASRATDEFETEIARVFAAASEAIGKRSEHAANELQPRLVWVHARGQYGPWDAPIEYQNSLRDDGDPPPVECTETPNVILASNDDPDTVFRYQCAYAAQIIALDACWQRLLADLDACANDAHWLIMLIGARGFPLGEHGRIGGVDSRLYAEQLHVPWLIRLPDDSGRLSRDGRLATHLDVLPTLLDWLSDACEVNSVNLDGISVLPAARNVRATERNVILSVSGSEGYSMRSSAWCLRDATSISAVATPATGTSELAELFVRPDDRREANDVAKLCPEVVEDLQVAAREIASRLAQEGTSASTGNS